MNRVDCHCPPLGLPSMRVKVRVRCEFADGREPTDTCFVAARSLGETREDVSAEILRRLTTLADFELPALGVALAFPFSSSTVRRVTVW